MCVGVVVENIKGEILLLRSRKWRNQWVVPGGAVEWGETFAEAGTREVREETGLSISDVRLIGVQEAVFPKNFHKKRHFVFIDLAARTRGERVTLNDEAHEYAWLTPRAALRKKLGGKTHELLRTFMGKKSPRA